MSTGFKKRLLVVWLALSAITLVYVWMDRSVDQDGTLRASAVVTVSAIVIALVKVRIIFREFMEVRHAPVLLCRLTDSGSCSSACACSAATSSARRSPARNQKRFSARTSQAVGVAEREPSAKIRARIRNGLTFADQRSPARNHKRFSARTTLM